MGHAAKMVGFWAVAVVPGGLVLLLALVLVRAVANHAQAAKGPLMRRVLEALGRVRLPDVWLAARQMLMPKPRRESFDA